MTNSHPLKNRSLVAAAGLVAALALFYACANVVSPTGGPRDEDPPEVVRSTPPDRATNFTGDEIRIFFNEFVQLQNIRQQLLVSPPLQQTPEVRIRGQSIIVEIEEELRPETTYNLFFGDAIRDITEGNAIPNFQFVFSTGSYVDSLSVMGQVKNAYNLEPEEGVYVMMYDEVYDSIPYLERPVYLAKTDENGHFRINNMAGGEYLMFGLRDNNANFLYDLPDEQIAFIDSLVTPEYIEEPSIPEDEDENGDGDPDTTLEITGEEVITTPAEAETRTDIRQQGDTLFPGDTLLPGDTLFPGDTLLPADTLMPGALHPAETFYTMYLFQEKDTAQRVSSSLERQGLIRVVFRVPYDSVWVREIRRPFEEDDWYIPEFNNRRDTLKIWFADTSRDSLFLEVLDQNRVLDTIRHSTAPRRIRERDPSEIEYDPLRISMNYRRASAVPYHSNLGIRSDHPIAEIDPGKITLFEHDSIPVEISFDFRDNVRRTLYIEPLPEPETPHQIEILPGAITDIFGKTNDTLRTRFTTTTTENYGRLILNIDLPHHENQFILELLDRNENVLRSMVIREDGTYRFDYLDPATYSVRLIDDKDETGQWDTGHYLMREQPDPVYMFHESVQIRENWDVELPWMVQ